MTREEFIKKYKNDCHYYFDGYYRDCIDDFLTNIYNEHEAQLKAKDIAIELLANACKLGLETQDKYRIIIKAKDEEIERIRDKA